MQSLSENHNLITLMNCCFPPSPLPYTTQARGVQYSFTWRLLDSIPRLWALGASGLLTMSYHLLVPRRPRFPEMLAKHISPEFVSGAAVSTKTGRISIVNDVSKGCAYRARPEVRLRYAEFAPYLAVIISFSSGTDTIVGQSTRHDGLLNRRIPESGGSNQTTEPVATSTIDQLSRSLVAKRFHLDWT